MKEMSRQSLCELFLSLSGEGRNLLIYMCLPAEKGLRRENIAAYSGIKAENLDSAMKELSQRGLVESGIWEEEGFVVGEGDRYRIPPMEKEQILRVILQF